MGNFVYIDTANVSYEDVLEEALKQSLSLAMDGFGKPKMKMAVADFTF